MDQPPNGCAPYNSRTNRRKLVKSGYALAFITLAVLFFPARASAQFTVCNRTSQDKISLAVVGTWYDIVNGQRVVDEMSGGWFSIAKGACTTVITSDISNDNIYIYAYSASNPSIKWADKYNFCMDPKNPFSYQGVAQVKPPCKVGSPLPTMYVETSGGGPDTATGLPIFTFNLVDKK
jgi:uncharacterized membrane protein